MAIFQILLSTILDLPLPTVYLSSYRYENCICSDHKLWPTTPLKPFFEKIQKSPCTKIRNRVKKIHEKFLTKEANKRASFLHTLMIQDSHQLPTPIITAHRRQPNLIRSKFRSLLSALKMILLPPEKVYHWMKQNNQTIL